MSFQGIFLRHLNEHTGIQMLKRSCLTGTQRTKAKAKTRWELQGLLLTSGWIEGNVLLPCTGGSLFTDILTGLLPPAPNRLLNHGTTKTQPSLRRGSFN